MYTRNKDLTENHIKVFKKEKLQQPNLSKINDTHFVLNEDYKYYWKVPAKNPDLGTSYEIHNWITVKAGFRWDGASVPGYIRKFGIETDGLHRAAALIHDFIYIHKGKIPEGSMVSSNGEEAERTVQHGTFSREDADRLFANMMDESGVPISRLNFMSWGVSAFGWIYWQDGPDLMRKLIWNVVSYLLLLFLAVLACIGMLDDTVSVVVISTVSLLTIGLLLKTLRFF